MKKILSLTFVGFLIASCQPTKTPLPNIPDVEFCEPAEQHLKALCDEAAQNDQYQYCCELIRPTKKGKTYSTFCKEKMAQGVNINPKCISVVKDCSLVEDCSITKKDTE